ncbi:GspE/PulE family protein [Chloroflexota bacterium]
MANSVNSERALREALIESELVTAEQLNDIAPGEERPKLGQLLVDRGIISPEELATVLGLQLGLPYIDLNICQIQPEALKLISESVARKYNVIPIAVIDNSLQVAMSDGNDVMTIEALSARTHMRIEPMIAVPEEIHKAIDRNYKSYGEIEKQFSNTPVVISTTKERISDESIIDAPAVRALDLILDEAIKNRTSDIHIEPEEERLRLRYRIDGVLHDIMSLPLSAHAPILSRLKILSNMNIADHRPQDGQFSVRVRGKEVDIRVATIATTYGEMGVLRILDKSFAILNLSEIGFSADNLEQYEQMMKSPFGMILISGPTGSGKTTTLYASISGLDCNSRNIITIEDPVEYHLKGINQIQVNPRASLTFADGLRAVMRHDPDVILVGEIRDAETAAIAVQAALTGHLVLASIHANDIVGVLFRLLDLGVEPFLVASALVGVVAQRMVRRVCSHCLTPSPAPIEGQLAYNKEFGEERTEFYYGKGCNSCAGTGYQGRIAVFEILRMSDEIRRRLLTGASAAQIRDQANEEGTTSMWHDGMLKVKSGITTPCEVLRNVFSLS